MTYTPFETCWRYYIDQFRYGRIKDIFFFLFFFFNLLSSTAGQILPSCLQSIRSCVFCIYLLPVILLMSSTHLFCCLPALFLDVLGRQFEVRIVHSSKSFCLTLCNLAIFAISAIPIFFLMLRFFILFLQLLRTTFSPSQKIGLKRNLHKTKIISNTRAYHYHEFPSENSALS